MTRYVDDLALIIFRLDLESWDLITFLYNQGSEQNPDFIEVRGHFSGYALDGNSRVFIRKKHPIKDEALEPESFLTSKIDKKSIKILSKYLT